MELLNEPLPGVLELRARVFDDSRGSFSETFSRRTMAGFGVDQEFVQDNESVSTTVGTVRGLHLQADPFAQGKLVRVLTGRIFDVAVDVRRGSPHFAKYVAVELSAENHHQLFVPKGFAHGFLVLSEFAEVEYKCSDFYHPGSELSIAWNDPQIGIPWPASDPLLSAKDAEALTLEEAMERLPPFDG